MACILHNLKSVDSGTFAPPVLRSVFINSVLVVTVIRNLISPHGYALSFFLVDEIARLRCRWSPRTRVVESIHRK